MRRPLAVIFALLFAIGPLQGLFGASENLRLPACCRRHGAHHCEMSTETQSALEAAGSSTPVLKAPATCPEFPGFVLSNLNTAHALAASHAGLPFFFEQAHEHIADAAAPKFAPSLLHSGRAPPTSL